MQSSLSKVICVLFIGVSLSLVAPQPSEARRGA